MIDAPVAARPPWWERRAEKRVLGGTDAQAIIGVPKYRTLAAIYDELVLGRQEERTKEQLRALERGKREEPRVRAMYLEACSEQVILRPADLIIAHGQYDFATCSPDDITVGGRLVEYKTVNRWSPDWKGGPPLHYLAQVLWNLWVMDLQEADLWAAFGEDKKNPETGEWEFPIRNSYRHRIVRDAEMDRRFEVLGEHFWRVHIIGRRRP